MQTHAEHADLTCYTATYGPCQRRRPIPEQQHTSFIVDPTRMSMCEIGYHRQRGP